MLRICIASSFVMGGLGLAFSAAAELNGRLTVDPGPMPVFGVLVTLSSLDRAFQTRSTQDGQFRFDHVPGGAYNIDFVLENYVPQNMPIELSGSAPRSLAISLKLTSQPDMNYCGPHSAITYSPLTTKVSRVTGVVRTYENLRPLGNAELTLSPMGVTEPSYTSWSNQHGQFEFDAISAGRYALKVSRHGYLPVAVNQLLVPRENNVAADIPIQKDDKRIIVCQ